MLHGGCELNGWEHEQDLAGGAGGYADDDAAGGNPRS